MANEVTNNITITFNSGPAGEKAAKVFEYINENTDLNRLFGHKAWSD